MLWAQLQHFTASPVESHTCTLVKQFSMVFRSDGSKAVRPLQQPFCMCVALFKKKKTNGKIVRFCLLKVFSLRTLNKTFVKFKNISTDKKITIIFFGTAAIACLLFLIYALIFADPESNYRKNGFVIALCFIVITRSAISFYKKAISKWLSFYESLSYHPKNSFPRRHKPRTHKWVTQ